MTHAAMLESFDDIEDGHPLQNPSFQAGFDAGLAEASAQSARDADRLRAELVQAISDMDYTFAEAHAAIMASLSLFMEDLAKILLPGMAADCFRTQVISVLQGMAIEQAAQVLSVRVHPSQLSSLQEAVQDYDVNARFTPDADIKENEAWIADPDCTVQVDMHAALAEVTEIMSAGSTPQDETMAQS